MAKVHPRCTTGITETYISAEGFVFPCCWMANEPHIGKVREFLGPLFDQLDLRKSKISDILDGEAFAKISDSWMDGSFEPCMRFCGKPLNHDPKNKRNKPDKHYGFNH